MDYGQSGGRGGMRRPGMRRPGMAPAPNQPASTGDDYGMPGAMQPEAPQGTHQSYGRPSAGLRPQSAPVSYPQETTMLPPDPAMPTDGMLTAPGAPQAPAYTEPSTPPAYGDYGVPGAAPVNQQWAPSQPPAASPYPATQPAASDYDPRLQGYGPQQTHAPAGFEYEQGAAVTPGGAMDPLAGGAMGAASPMDPLAVGDGYDPYQDYAQGQGGPGQAAAPQARYQAQPSTAMDPSFGGQSSYDEQPGIDPTKATGILGAATDSEEKIAAAEEKAVENIERRDLRDIRDVRRGRKSKLQPDAVVDARKKAKTVRMVTLTMIVLLLALAVFNVVVPRKQWSAAEIQSISKVANGDTGFPLQEGAGVATQFMKAYLEAGTDETASNQMLQTFYNGQTYADVAQEGGSETGNTTNMQGPSDVLTKIQSGPYVYEARPVSADGMSATYKLGALVYRQNTTDGQPILTADGKTVAYKWVFYQVDLIYDSKTEKFSVSKNSPVRVAEPGTNSASTAPEAELPGDGQEIDELQNDDMQKFVTQFFTSWGASDDTALSVMIDKKQSKPSVTRGLDGTVSMAGEPSFKVYGPPSTDNYYRVLATVTWKETITDQSSYTQTSTYVLKLKKANGKFYVIDVQPYLYIPQKTNDSGE